MSRIADKNVCACIYYFTPERVKQATGIPEPSEMNWLLEEYGVLFASIQETKEDLKGPSNENNVNAACSCLFVVVTLLIA